MTTLFFKRCLALSLLVIVFSLVFIIFSAFYFNTDDSTKKKYEVIIMGAGMSGIAAATELCAEGVDPRDILIIEGANYIGGRTKVAQFANHSLNIGASWLEGACAFCNESFKDQFEVNPILELADKYGILYVEDDFDSEMYFDPLNHTINYTQLWSAYDEYDEALKCVDNEYAATIDNHTKDYDESKEGDSLKFALENCGWSDLNIYQTFVEWYSWDFESAVGPEECSAFSTHEIYETYGNNELYIVDPLGFNGIVTHLADELIEKGVRIRLNEIITSITYGDDVVSVRTEDGKTYKSKYALNTFSVGVLQSDAVEFSPILPEWKQEVINKHLMTDYVVIYIQWPYDWWSLISNYTEQLLFIEEEKGYFPWAKDLNLDKYFADSNMWRVDVDNDLARKIQRQSVDDTINEYLDKLSLYFEDVPDPLDVLITNWTNNIFTLGSWSDWNVGFTLDDWELMAEPVCNLYFSGEAYSREQYGYVSGAYLEGIRAAQQILLCVNDPNNQLCLSKCAEIQNEQDLYIDGYDSHNWHMIAFSQSVTVKQAIWILLIVSGIMNVVLCLSIKQCAKSPYSVVKFDFDSPYSDYYD